MVGLALPAPAMAQTDYADTALNIIPSGQWGGVPVRPDADVQAKMYDGLTPLFDDVTKADLTTYFKSESFGVDTATPSTIEAVPRPGVTIERDSYNVPHVNGATHDDGVWAAGWIAAEDRGLLLEQARYNARVAAIDVPASRRSSLISGLQQLHAQRPDRSRDREADARCSRPPGRRARRCWHDIDVFVTGINDYRAAQGSSIPPWTRNDVYALNALKGQFVGQGGGDEARRSQFFGGLQQRLGRRRV